MPRTRIADDRDRSGCPAPYHGDDNAYRNADPGCRCPDARDHHRIVLKQIREGRYRSRLVPAIGTIRRLQALAVNGWTFDALADHLGVHPSHVAALSRTKRRVNVDTHTLIRDLYTRLADQPGGSERATNRAQRRGWIGPDEWIPGELDDPAANPRPRTTQAGWFDQGLVDAAVAGLATAEQTSRMNPREREAAMAAMHLYAPGFVAHRLGCAERTVHRFRAKQRQHDSGEPAA